MRILEYAGLDASAFEAPYRKVVAHLARDDFRAAQVKKLVGVEHGKYYRARLDEAARLIFTLVRHESETCALMLEILPRHEYERSRFLRGAALDEDRIPEIDAVEAMKDAQPLRYLHPERATLHLLDKPISFDDAQEAIYRQPPPLIVVGSAGSGKTALTLEKLKHAPGEVLYVTHSAYLAQNARELYYAHGFDHPGQEATFLSYTAFLESLRVLPGREALWRDFAAWFARLRQAFKGVEAHQAFEEIRGVIAAGAEGVLARHAYLGLGVRQSIFAPERRNVLYDLFEKYRAWLDESGLYDPNLIAHAWLELAAPRYDFIVIDEVQDLTAVQLALALKTLRKPGQFLLCGDSNQIVHPNFFAWSRVKSLFWGDPALAERQELRVLAANFRNGHEATRVANGLLKIKQRRFGSIDRESNFLVEAVGGEAGEVGLLPDRDEVKRELDGKIRRSIRFAVLVMRDEDKAAARTQFGTPLIFAIHEAKGLEYENIVLYRFVSDHRGEFAEIAAGVTPQDLAADTLDYRRARDKGDKALEVYKFFVNALYVAITRATRNVYLIEADGTHPLFGLLGLTPSGPLKVEAGASTLEEWQKEARRLELQGKQEQAEAIQRTILKQTPPPWPVFDEAGIRQLLDKVFRERAPGSKYKQQLYEIAACHDEPVLAERLVREAGHDPARQFERQRMTLGRKSYVPYFASHFKDVLRQCERHGLEHRLPMNQTPLMAAAAAGNVALAEALLERGAKREAADHYGWNALHWALREAFRDAKFARGPFAALYELLAPPSLDVNTGDRLVRLDRHLSEYLLVQTLWTLFKSRFTHRQRRPYGAFETRDVLAAWEHLPANVLRPERRRREHLNQVLARNEVERDYAYNRALFVRLTQGWYQFNPKLGVRAGAEESAWAPLYGALNLPLIKAFAQETVWGRIDAYLAQAGLLACDHPFAAECEQAPRDALRPARAVETKAQQRQAEEAKAEEPKWGTPEAREREIERVRQAIEARKRGGPG